MLKLFQNKRIYNIYAVYSKNELAGAPFINDIVNIKDLSYIIYNQVGFNNIRLYAQNFNKKYSKQDIRKKKYLFEKMCNSYPLATHSTQEGYIIPPQICFYDKSSNYTYHIVLIEDKCEIRRTKYSQRDYKDKHCAVTNKKIIKRIEMTFQFWVLSDKTEKKERKETKEKFIKPIGELFGIKSFPNTIETAEEVLEYVCKKGYMSYIDWKLEYKDVLHNFNNLMEKNGPGNKLALTGENSLCGEDAVREIFRNFSCEGYKLVMIDINADGFYIAVLNKETSDALEPVLNKAGFKYL
jgi:hypothetical protein